MKSFFLIFLGMGGSGGNDHLSILVFCWPTYQHAIVGGGGVRMKMGGMVGTALHCESRLSIVSFSSIFKPFCTE
jgi:hypothetical protein